MAVAVDLLGALRVTVDGQPREVPGARLRTLLVELALAGGTPVSAAGLGEAVWEGTPPADAAAALQSLVSRLRRVLGAAAVEQSGAGYRLAVTADDVDGLRATDLVGRGRQALREGDPRRAAELVGRARALWRGGLAAELPLGAVVRLEQLRRDVLAVAAEADLLQGRPPDDLTELAEAVAAAPLDERMTGLLIQALDAAGRPAEAVQAYERLRRGLAEELGLDPSPGLQARHLELLRRERAAAPPAPPLSSSWTSFVGRHAELDRVAALLSRSRLVTVLGPGGGGKTRLALEVAHGQVGRQVWLVELAPVTDPAEVPQTVLAALGRREGALLETRTLDARTARRDATALLVETLAAREALLVLDNCEHLLDAAAGLVDTLLSGCPGLRVLVTSREPLGLVGEVLAPLPPLAVPPAGAGAREAGESPAVRLLLDRGAAVKPGFALTDATAPAVVDVVRRLDGLPLAIELAAACLRTLPVAEVARRLSDRFRLLTGGSRTALPRHRTLHAVVAWSWDLLTAPERLLAERLSVLAGGISDASAGAVGGPDLASADDVPDLLAGLVDRSLLEQVGGEQPRYRMLETIREFGIERLAARAELAAVRGRAAAHFAALAAAADAQLRTAGQVPALALLRLEHDNLLAALRQRCDDGCADDALRLALDLSWFWLLLGRDAEAAAGLGAALDVPGGEPDLRAQAEVVLALSRSSPVPDGPSAPPPAAPPRDAAALVAGLDVRARPAVALAVPVVQYFTGARAASRAVLDLLAEDPDPWLAAASRLFRARIAENDGDLACVRADAELALPAFRRLGDRWGVAAVLPLVALVRQYDGDLEGAREALLEAERSAEGLGRLDVRDELFVRLRLVDVQSRLGQAQEALAGCRDARELAAQGGSPEMAAVTAAVSAGVARVLGALDEAAVQQRAADDALAALQTPQLEQVTALVEASGALLALHGGHVGVAFDRLCRAYPAAVRAQDLPILALVGVSVAALAMRRGRPLDAARVLGAATRLRGAPDRTSPDLMSLQRACRRELGDDVFCAAYDVGRALDPAAATAALDPALSRG